MSTSRAIKPKRDDTQLTNWQPMPERAPSLEVADRPVVARIFAMIGLFLTVLGTLAMLAPRWQRAAVISPGWGFFFTSIGVCFILYHTFVERDIQFRRLYGFVGLALLVGGVAARLMAFKAGYASAFVLYGLPAMVIGLIALVAVIRNETEVNFRTLLLNIVGALAAILIAFAGAYGLRVADYLAGEGAVIMLLGLLFASAYIGQQETGSDRAYFGGLGLGAVGVAGLIIGMIRSFWPESTFLVPGGLILMGFSIVYIAVALGVCSDWPVIVLARRELATFFFSPVGYLVFIGQLACGWIMFFFFVQELQEGVFEPIMGPYIFNLFPVMVQTLLIPALTMRLMSEEKRSGTLEVLLTAPVNEISIVVGKFLACWIFFMLLWIPWWLFLVSLRYVGNEEFDYRPILSFTVALASTGSGFIAIGLFFSSLTSNQIIAAVFSFVMMLAHLAAFYLGLMSRRPGTAWAEVFAYVNYFDFWRESLAGTLAPRLVIFHVSVAVFFLFATVKLLESRKWK